MLSDLDTEQEYDFSEIVADKKWSVNSVIEATRTHLKDLRLPQMEPPTGLGIQYKFPSNVGDLSSVQLGNLSLQLGGYYTYSLMLIGTEESDLGAYEETFNIMLGVRVAEEAISRAKMTKGVTPKETLQAICISQDETLKRVFQSLIARRHRLSSLKVQAEIYKEQLNRLSREQTRREAEANTRRTI